MYKNKRIAVVMPAYNAEKTLRQTYDEVVAQDIVDDIILVDDGSRDQTVSLARTLPNVLVHQHVKNLGYGGNQKTCYRLALAQGADIIIMVHPDYQYTPLLLPAMVALLATDIHPIVLGSRILGGYALQGGMPWWKYLANRGLTFSQNFLMGAKLSEYHTGYRGYTRAMLERMQLDRLSNDFIFDNQFLAQALSLGASIGEISCPTKYFDEASSINFRRSVIYGLGCLRVAVGYCLHFRLRAAAAPSWAKTKTPSSLRAE